jgi:hypothetical protein
VRRRKVARAAAHNACDPQRVDLLGGEINTDAAPRKPTLQSVYHGHRCLGFLWNRNKAGIEGFDIPEHSLGTFPTMKEAADAVSRAARDAA